MLTCFTYFLTVVQPLLHMVMSRRESSSPLFQRESLHEKKSSVPTKEEIDKAVLARSGAADHDMRFPVLRIFGN